MDESTEKKLNELSVLEQNLQFVLSQKNNFSTQLLEIESALSQIKEGSSSYRIVGSIMVEQSYDKIKSFLDEKKNALESRIKSLESREKSFKEKVEDLQAVVLKEFEKER